jgi:radical SAM family uncharacterized protein/radical SAM-linked protein
VRREAIRRVNPISDLGGKLLNVEKPSRYLGGEVGSIRKADDGLFTIALCFPDLYEIGMSNNAIRILYSGLNAKRGVRAERVFAPAPDFEALLHNAGLPLYTLESGIALSDVDMLGISLGYELAATSVLSVLASGRIPIMASDRREGDPLVIVGGPAATNPHPFARFLDAAYIGEAEAGFFDLAQELSELKNSGATRVEILERLARSEAIWIPSGGGASHERTFRAVFSGFSQCTASTALPLPTVKIVQDHGTVEIMRGCPNGCRFCHAGYFYRPQREKPYEIIRAEVEDLVTNGGYREITLSSLSSGDYSNIGELLDKLNAEFRPRQVSFQLPSLKVNSFTLPILEKLAEVRKSGLTFAVETPIEEWQRSVNKEVSFEKTISILKEARTVGFKQAKFYFMIGLPVPGRGMGEVKAIIDFFKRQQACVSMPVNVNIGVFVPKPHTPYQWAPQMTEDEALAAINTVKSELRKYRNIKLSYHSPFTSQLEGVIARGDERVGELIYAAYQKGARLDAWEEHFDRELWRSVISSVDWPVIETYCKGSSTEVSLPWDDVTVRIPASVFQRELTRSESSATTSACIENCTEKCGVCGRDLQIIKACSTGEEIEEPSSVKESGVIRQSPTGRIVFRYYKEGIAAYMQHLSIIDAFSRALSISGIDVAYSEGFNPMPRIETTQPIAIAIESTAEVASVMLVSRLDTECFIESMNRHLPDGLSIHEAMYFPIQTGKKLWSIGSLEWGSDYRITGSTPEESQELADKVNQRIRALGISLPDSNAKYDSNSEAVSLRLRSPKQRECGLLRILETCLDDRPVQSRIRVKRISVFADAGDGEPVSFFNAYSKLS